MLTLIFGIDHGPAARHSIKLESVELRTCREVFVTGRVLVARRPLPGYFAWRELDQVDLLIDHDWKFWHFQFLPFMRPKSWILYAEGREAPAWAGMAPGDQLSYSPEAPDELNRRVILMHTLWPVGECPFDLDELEGKVLEMSFLTVDLHNIDTGEQITGAWNHEKLGTKQVKGGHEVTQCPWLLPQDTWQHRLAA